MNNAWHDGTLDAEIIKVGCAGDGVQITAALPAGLAPPLPAGRYFLVRCGAQSREERLSAWSIYARRALFAARVTRLDADRDAWTLHAQDDARDAGVAWLRERTPGETLNLLGPLGNGFPAPDAPQNLLLVTDSLRLPLLDTLIHATLDRGGRVTLIVVAGEWADVGLETLRSALPIAAEVRMAAEEGALRSHLQETLVWADGLAVALPGLAPAALANWVRDARLRVEEGFAQVLMQADLVCGSGACLACVVPTAGGGLTRACVNGPVFDLVQVAGGR